MKIYVDFFKPSGKWYAGGEVDVGEARLWRDNLLQAIWDNQMLLNQNTERSQWTVVSREADQDDNEFCRAVLQVGKNDS